MKKLITITVACMLLVMSSAVSAQVYKCCDTDSATVAPEMAVGFYSTNQIGAAPDTTTKTPVLAVQATPDLPNVEYLITKRNYPAHDAVGNIDTAILGSNVGDTIIGSDIVIGADVDGIFKPSEMGRYGVTLHPGDTFDITAIGYDLAFTRELADSLLNGKRGAGTCCNLFLLISIQSGNDAIAGFCDTVNAAGIHGSADINNLGDVLTIFDAFGPAEMSLASLIESILLVNDQGHNIKAECGGTGQMNFLPYGAALRKQYGYDNEGTIAVQTLSEVSVFTIFPNPTEKDEVEIYLTTTKEIDLNVNIYDALGQRVQAKSLGNVSGNISTQIPVNNLSSGVYFVELTDGHSNQVTKLVVK